jgi:hypothetical protein
VAVDVFLLSCAARAVRGQDKEHNSMLVHVSRFVDVHGRVYEQVLKYLDITRSFIAGGDKPTIDRLHEIWTRDFMPTTAAILPTVFGRQTTPISWVDVIGKLADTSDRVRVVVTNGKTKAGLDYDSYKGDGLSVIAIGGDKLSRGLTLEGLSVSYFLRVAKQYDSLLQMGRWFGYRRGFADLCRLYTTPDMADWFTHVATANQELRSDLAYMQLMLQTPKEYGLRVAGHSIMAVTAQNKQREKEKSRRCCSVILRSSNKTRNRQELFWRSWALVFQIQNGLEVPPARKGSCGKAFPAKSFQILCGISLFPRRTLTSSVPGWPLILMHSCLWES